ncbi:hypothetical protein G6L37_07555 [Agrobacterium rubi]|nr:hypothetical protein [Agrobacterium rubi]NTF25224.1 hypothetical protein [Agrobacterium rubi]
MTAETQKTVPRDRGLLLKRDTRDGLVVGPDGCSYRTEGSALFHSLSCTCSCGCADEQHEFIRKALSNFDRSQGWEAAAGIAGIEALVRERPDVAAEFVAHVLASESLVEYGGSVYGAWLTERGKQYTGSDDYKDILDALDELKEKGAVNG